MTVRTQIFSGQRNGKDSFVWNKIDKEKEGRKKEEKKTRVYLYEHVHLHVSETSLFVRSIQMLPLRVRQHKPNLQHTTKLIFKLRVHPLDGIAHHQSFISKFQVARL